MKNRIQLVIGMGKTGEALGHWLRRKNQDFAFFDTRPQPPQKFLIQKLFPDVNLYCGKLPDDIWSRIKGVYVSPGVDCQHPVIKQTIEKDIPLSSDIDCLATEIGNSQIITITGTNGKSTVTELVGLMAKADQRSVVVAGNIGAPVLNKLESAPKNSIWVLELSSFQLDLVKHLRASVATILNITPDHLDRHGTFAAYAKTKQKIYRQAEYVVYNREDENTYPNINVPTTSFGLDTPKEKQWGIKNISGQDYICLGTRPILPTASLQIKGQHFWKNAMAASALARQVNISFTSIKHILSTYKGLPYRTQWVATKHHVDYINDSKGTNVGATQSAIYGIGPTLAGKLILIAGGQGKGADFNLLQPSVSKYVKAAFVYGESGPIISNALKDHTLVIQTQDLSESLQYASAMAQPGDCVLFSPACASFDGFRDFNHRGEVFNNLVEDLT